MTLSDNTPAYEHDLPLRNASSPSRPEATGTVVLTPTAKINPSEPHPFTSLFPFLGSGTCALALLGSTPRVSDSTGCDVDGAGLLLSCLIVSGDG